MIRNGWGAVVRRLGAPEPGLGVPVRWKRNPAGANFPCGRARDPMIAPRGASLDCLLDGCPRAAGAPGSGSAMREELFPTPRPPHAAAGRAAAGRLAAALLAWLAPGWAGAAALPPAEGLRLVEELASPREAVRESAAERLVAAGDRSLLAPLVDQLFFTRTAQREQILRTLAALTGESGPARYLDWVAHVSGRQDAAPPPGYLGWKGRLFARIDPRYREILVDGAPARIAPQEIVSGGVPFDGIPSLDAPRHVPAARADYLEDGELVFGARVGGEARAWPLRILSWHEMLNDRLGGEPVTLSFCTLCRSALLFRARLPSGAMAGDETTFGTSGLLYRSNKLMFDRRTRTLWANLTGEPVLGPLAAEPRALEMLPLTVTTWAAWRRDHPDTTVLALEADRGWRHGYDYRPGAADARRAGVSFPVPARSRLLPDQEEVYGLRLAGAVKAYPVRALVAAVVVNDALAGEPVVLHAEPGSGAVRAFRRGGERFAAGPAPGELVDGLGRLWRVTEEALVPAEPVAPPLPRLPGNLAWWFGWFAFYPQTEVYSPPAPP